MLDILPDFQDATFVHVAGGAETFFWTDHWLGPAPFSVLVPALFSHVTRTHVTIAEALADSGWEGGLTPRLSNVATSEKVLLMAALQDVTLITSAADSRFLKGTRKPFSAKGAYSQHMAAHPDNPLSKLIWNSELPPKGKFFFWLLHLDRLPTRARLHYRHISDSDVCPFCSSTESQEHQFLHCLRIIKFWNSIGAPKVTSSSSLHDIWEVPSVWELQPSPLRSLILIAVLWNVWKARNALIFQNVHTTSLRTKQAITEDLVLWSHRVKNATDRECLKAWCDRIMNVT